MMGGFSWAQPPIVHTGSTLERAAVHSITANESVYIRIGRGAKKSVITPILLSRRYPTRIGCPINATGHLLTRSLIYWFWDIYGYARRVRKRLSLTSSVFA